MEPQEDVNSIVTQVAPDAIQEHVQQPQESQESVNERNWRQMREAKKQLERELAEERRLREQAMQFALAQQQQAQHPAKTQEVDELDAISDAEYIPKGTVKSLVKKEAAKIAQEIAKTEYDKMVQHQNQTQFVHRLKAQFNDFEDVVNKETLQILEEKEPELAQSIAALQDPYKMGLSSYKYIKALKLQEKASVYRREKEVDQKLADNAKTVQSPQAYDKRPMAQAFKMPGSKEEKQAIYREMMGYASQAGFSY